VEAYRIEVDVVHEDRFMHEDIEKSIHFIQTLHLDNEVIFD
jgi:histidine ammonia-lyase